MAQYRPLADLNGHAGMGGKTLLYMLDGIYSGRDFNGIPSKWAVLPFCSKPTCGTTETYWPTSLLLSMDQVAIDSVAFDFLSLRTDWTEVLAAEGVQDYLHEMALADNPPSGTFYDPEGDGTRLASQGVHEHWNNATDKKYTRNLGTGKGIELLYMPKATYVRKTDQPIVVDGNTDDAWSRAAVESINNVVLGTISNASDLSASYRALYDDTNLYFMVDVSDDVVMSGASPDWYDDDSVEIMIDGDYSRGTAYDGVNDFELGFRWNDLTIARGASSAPIPPGAEFKIVGTGTGYRLDVKLPIAQLGIAPTYGRLFGLDVHVNDADNGSGRDAQTAWVAQVDDSWQYPYRLGAGRLVAPERAFVEASLEGSQVHLRWTHYSWATLYEVHRGASPCFTPDDTTIVEVVRSSESAYLDTPPDSAPWYYLVRATESGLGSNSNRIGRLIYGLVVP